MRSSGQINTQFAKHGLDRHAEFFDAPLSEAEVLEGHSLIMRGCGALILSGGAAFPIMITHSGSSCGSVALVEGWPVTAATTWIFWSRILRFVPTLG